MSQSPWRIITGDVRKVCKTQLEAESFDAILSDPPYGISFMGRGWDYDVPSAMLWSEVLRVLKPGANAIIFSSTRTYHRMATMVEDAGFEPRDMLLYLHGKGFPKSLTVSKAIVDRLGHPRPVVGTKQAGMGTGKSFGMLQADGNNVNAPREVDITTSVSEMAKRWDGYQTALKPAVEPALLCRKPLDGTVVDNVLKWSVGGLAIDACRIGDEARINGSASPNGMWASLDQGERGGRPPVGRWPTNVILSHADGCELVGSRPSRDKATQTVSTGKPISSNRSMNGSNYGRSVVGSSSRPDEDVWKCVEGCPVRMLDEQSGNRPGMSGGGKHRADYPGGMFGGIDSQHTARGDSGGASRFFMVVKGVCGDESIAAEPTSVGKRTGSKSGCSNTGGSGSNITGLFPTGAISITRIETRSIMTFPILSVLTRSLTAICTLETESDTSSLTASNIESVSVANDGSLSIGIIQGGPVRLVGTVRIASAKVSKNGGAETERTTTPITGNIVGNESWRSEARFYYTTKASREERELGLHGSKRIAKGTDALRDHDRSEGEVGNGHPTVKPIDLCRYFARLILPPRGDHPRRILVPFSGSGSEMIGCLQAGWDEVVGIEREAEYVVIAKGRITKGGVFSGLADKKMRKREREREQTKGRRVYGKFARDK